MVHLHAGIIALLVGAAFLAGAINAVAGGGSLISFPALLAAGYPSVTANVTNIVAVLPGYLGGSLAYRPELHGQRTRIRTLGVASAIGAVIGAVLLLALPAGVFKHVVPFLILFSCALLAVQPLAARLVERGDGASGGRRAQLVGLIFASAVYGGYFGAGLGIMQLAILGIYVEDGLQRLNALKGLLSLVIAVASAVYLAFAGPVVWEAAGIMAGGALLGGQVGVRAARRLNATVLRALVVAYGVGIGIYLLVSGSG